MEELKTIGTYQEFKKALDTELYNQAEGFVRTGYLLKVARDTDILRESGYATVAEFAHAEYGLTKDVVSRYIAINDRYSEGGYSERLQTQYQGYGVAKLQDMLTLPDAIIEVMSPEMTRKDIQEVKREYKEEEANPMASLMETPKREQQDMTTLQQALHQRLYDNREEFIKGFDVAMRAETEKEEAMNGILDAFAPSGVGIKTVRIQGVGRVVISFKGKDTEVEVLKVRTQECQSYTWQQLVDELREVFMVAAEESGAEAWERIYGEEYEEKKEEVAPVQPSEQIVQLAAAVEEDAEENSEEEDGEGIPMGTASLADIVTGNVPKPTPEEIAEAEKKLKVVAEPQTLHDFQSDIPVPTPTENEEEEDAEEDSREELEEQLPGQDNIMNHPEYLPDDLKNAENETPQTENETEMPEKTECGADSAEPVESTTCPPGQEECDRRDGGDEETCHRCWDEYVQREQARIEADVNKAVEDVDAPAAVVDEEEWLDELWNSIEIGLSKLNLFMQDYKGELPPHTSMELAYKNAVSVAADMERMLNHVPKHTA